MTFPRFSNALRLAAAMAFLSSGMAHAVPMPAHPILQPDSLKVVARTETQIWTQVGVTRSGDLLILAPRWPGNTGPQLLLQQQGGNNPVPFPDAGWNAIDGDPDKHFVSLTGLTVLPDGTIWILDNGAPQRDHAAIAAARLIRIDPDSHAVTKIIPITADAMHPDSFLAGISIHGSKAYILDSGVAGLLLTDLETGNTRRFLDHNAALTAQRPINGPDGMLHAANGNLQAIDASLITISPDGRWIYFQPYCGPLYRLETQILTDPATTVTALDESPTLWYKTGSMGGLTAGSDGTLYWTDVTTGSIESYTQGRVPHRIITDPNMHWPGGLATDNHGKLFIPVSQLDRAPWFTHGPSRVVPPVTIRSLDIPDRAISDVVEK